MTKRSLLNLATALSSIALSLTGCSPTNSGTASPTSSDVTVAHAPAADQSAPCQSSANAVHTTVLSTASEFVVTINVTAPLCSPVLGKGVIYAMPGNGVAWPQELVKVEPFTLSAAGATTVTFTKGCGAAQFDVVTGATPQTIANGLGHGALIDPAAAQQYWGAPCVDPTTTEPTTSTTSTSTSTTTEPTTSTTSTSTTTSTTSTTSTTTTSTTTSTTSTSTTTSTTTTTAPPLLPLEYTGTADKSVGCYSGAAGDDTFHQVLGTDGYWDFYFQGCSAFATETVALDDPPGGPFANAFESPTGYKCKMSIDGTSDSTGYYTNQIGSVADTGGLIFLSSANTFTSNWNSPTTWRINCIPV